MVLILVNRFYFRIETDMEKQLKTTRQKELQTTYYGENTCLPPKRSKILVYNIVSYSTIII